MASARKKAFKALFIFSITYYFTNASCPNGGYTGSSMAPNGGFESGFTGWSVTGGG